ncbi:MAG: prepilin-type N-terminal cleavage/methylation domain-containing protein [Phycisphaerae bacterium]|nr:prepilin-type N-terminal cleavage/methylation domain-containing protein [Phycisphaerae bacterium]
MRTHAIPRRHAARGFTLVEVTVTMLIIVVLITLVFAGVTAALRSAREAGERQLVSSVARAVDQFRQQFGFLPPLADDENPVDETNNVVRVRDAAFLRFESDLDKTRWSETSLGIYLLGILEKDVDGIDGPGMTKPTEGGGFAKGGARIEPLLDAARMTDRIKRDQASGFEFADIHDRWGGELRYYRWLPRFYRTGAQKGQIETLNTPSCGLGAAGKPIYLLGDPAEDPALRAATWAIVCSGPNRFFGDEPASDLPAMRAKLAMDDSASEEAVRRKAASDNIWEAGK